MCGLFGVIDRREPVALERAEGCLDALAYRGPNGAGSWSEAGIYMGHRRLSILDLSEAGAQPMESETAVIAVNGEIYNFKALKKELQARYSFRGNSDSEVVLHGYMEWGIEGLCARLDGMYALVIYDKAHDRLHLVRDRAGIKPLYYAQRGEQLVWSSELAPIERYLGLGEGDICPQSLLDFATYRFIPAPKSLYRNVCKLPAASVATYERATDRLRVSRYWDLQPGTASGTRQELLEQAQSLLRASVRQQLVSDVPLGCFLSGGIDSGLVAALAAETISDLPTYSIGFDEGAYDESRLIRCSAEWLGSNNHLQIIDSGMAGDLFAKLRQWYAEPFADFSCIPTYQLCNFTSRDVTVALSGDGADELFAGYPRYLAMGSAAMGQGRTGLNRRALGWLKQRLGWSLAGRVVRLLEARLLNSAVERYCLLNGGLLDNETSVLADFLGVASDYDRYWAYRQHEGRGFEGTAQWRYVDLCSTLPDMLLAKVDRLSMQCSLEVRVPYLGKDLMEFAFTLPDEVLVANGQPKSLLREVAAGFLPPEVTRAPKKGFGIPKSHRLSQNGKRCSAQYKVLSEFYPELKVAKYIK